MIPSGLPAWTRSATIGNYGGDIDKRNFLSQGVIDPTTDVGAEELARITADMQAVALTSPFAVITYLNEDTSPGAPLIQTVYMQTGISLVSYVGSAAPAGFPSALREGTGDVTFTFDTSYTDPYGIAGQFSIQHVGADAQTTTGIRANAQKVTPSTVRVRCFTGGSAVGNAIVTLSVW